MARLIKILLIALAAVVGVVAVAAIGLLLFFDPNDFRDRISASVKNQTGRDLVIQGDLSLSLFPWIAVEVGTVVRNLAMPTALVMNCFSVLNRQV